MRDYTVTKTMRDDAAIAEFIEEYHREQPAPKHHGHPKFYEYTAKEVELHDQKNHDYAKGGNPLGNFLRVASILGLYPGLKPEDPVVVCLTYALKQMDAVLWGLANAIEHKVEGLHPRLEDISVYAKIARCILSERTSPQPSP